MDAAQRSAAYWRLQMVRTKLIEINETVRQVNFGLKDSKGREIGALVVQHERDFIDAADGWTSTPAGHYFHAKVQASRDGYDYGSHQGGKLFSNQEDSDKYVASRLKDSEKAAQKLAAK